MYFSFTKLFLPFSLSSSSLSLKIVLYLEWTGNAKAYPVIADHEPTFGKKLKSRERSAQ